MLLLTGATGEVGAALLRRLLADGVAVRCLVRDPRRLGSQRVRVQIALGDLTDPPSFRNAMRGVGTVVHLAASLRDQPRGSIEELNAIATWRMVQAAREAGAERFVFFSALGASAHHRSRFFRAKALAEAAVRKAGMRSIIFAPSIVYAPGDRWLTTLEKLKVLPAMPVAGDGTASYQPLWAGDAADCVARALHEASAREPTNQTMASGRSVRYELAGPQTLTHDQMVAIALRAHGASKPLLHVPSPLACRALNLLERTMRDRAFATWDEAELMQSPMVSSKGDADVRALGVRPQRMEAVLEAAASPKR